MQYVEHKEIYLKFRELFYIATAKINFNIET
jgi:hypothetical protein